jgi:hypothetical protein
MNALTNVLLAGCLYDLEGQIDASNPFAAGDRDVGCIPFRCLPLGIPVLISRMKFDAKG